MASIIGQRGYYPTQQPIFLSPDQLKNSSAKPWQGLFPVQETTPKPVSPSIVQPEVTTQEIVKPHSSIPQQKSRPEQHASPSASETTSLWQQQAGTLLKQYGPSLMKQFGPPLARKVGFPVAQHLGPPLARKVGIPLAKRLGTPLMRRLFIPLAKRAGFALIRRFGFPF